MLLFYIQGNGGFQRLRKLLKVSNSSTLESESWTSPKIQNSDVPESEVWALENWVNAGPCLQGLLDFIMRERRAAVGPEQMSPLFWLAKKWVCRQGRSGGAGRRVEAGSPVATCRQGTEAEVCFGTTEPEGLVEHTRVEPRGSRMPVDLSTSLTWPGSPGDLTSSCPGHELNRLPIF